MELRQNFLTSFWQGFIQFSHIIIILVKQHVEVVDMFLLKFMIPQLAHKALEKIFASHSVFTLSV